MLDLSSIRPLADAAHRWLSEQAWPLWVDRGIDRASGGFHEHLSFDYHRCSADFRRLRVVTRQITVFAAAAHEGVAGAAEAVRLGCEFLRQRAKQPDGGFAWRFDLAGRPTDFTRDLYDHAFVLLAWSTAAAFLPSGLALAEAHELDHYLQSNFRHPAGGYTESLPGSEPRRQNPHMHLLEAYLHAAEQWNDQLFFDRGGELIALFLERLFQPREGALPEFFDEHLIPLRLDGRFMAEPGHHAEWVWLLDWYRELAPRFGATLPRDLDATVAALAKSLRSPACLTPSGALVDEIWSDGTLRAGSARLWPQTERLKFELLAPSLELAAIDQAYSVLAQFIAGAPAGLWHERWTPDHGFLSIPAPASSLYHLTTGILVSRRRLQGGNAVT